MEADPPPRFRWRCSAGGSLSEGKGGRRRNPRIEPFSAEGNRSLARDHGNECHGNRCTLENQARGTQADAGVDLLRSQTGKLHEVTIWFALDGDQLYVGTANVNRQWVRNVQKTPHVRLSVGEEKLEGTARFLTNDQHECAMRAMRRKYWIFRPVMELGRFLSSIGLMRDKTGSFGIVLTA
jgi:hypothetical protein